MKEKLTALIEVRKIIALLITLLFIGLSITGSISSDKTFEVVLIVIAFYFGKSTALDRPK